MTVDTDANRRRWLGAALAATWLPTRVFSQVQPKVTTFVIPQAPGGSNDAMGRALAARLPRFLPSAVIVENRQGANGNIGSAWVAKSAPKDGSVWLVTVNSTLTINPFLYSRPGFESSDFVPVAGIALVPHVLVVKSDHPVTTMTNIVELARRSPGKYSYGSSGNGTFSHLLMEQMKQTQKLDIAHVPYKGVAPALTDLIGGQIDYLISTVPAAQPFIKSGQVRPIAVTSLSRAKALPETPLANETVPGMVGELWVALFAPAGTPADAVSQMRGAVAKVQELADMQEFLAVQGAAPLLAGPAELQAMTEREIERWGPIVKKADMKID